MPQRELKSIATGPAKFDSRARGWLRILESRSIEEEQNETKSAQTLAYVTSLEAHRPGVAVCVRAGMVPSGMGATVGKWHPKPPINRIMSGRRYSYSNMSINKGVLALNYIQHQRIQFVAQAVPHQCIAHHGAEHRAAAAAEKTTASASPSRLWIQSCPG